jgi:hypothetical protein
MSRRFERHNDRTVEEVQAHRHIVDVIADVAIGRML